MNCIKPYLTKVRMARGVHLQILILWVVIACLSLFTLMLKQEVSTLRQHGGVEPPIPLQEVALKFQEQTSVRPISTTVTDVRYSNSEDAYKIRFTWSNEENIESWQTVTYLNSDGYGRYVGTVENKQILEPLGREQGLFLAVETPSRYSSP